ncbi:YdcF family protein [Planotetraspora sp. A-T 1434]|uniref:YdcF family protein n=1 Tax=Planotetraspora sp. A-T 1434 TaxID=2979219 RepID=UPI0021C15D3A|nr:YdcF family protein [Planotetraspora sp. A-T 1434]MCT9933181.1 YdcF family protein [Planotetraspora sp. A-T 1434]
MTARAVLPEAIRADVETLWDYHDLRHAVRPADVGIGLGSHDLGVATCAADLYHRGMFPLIVFTGANAPTTVAVFPRGEAVHYQEHAIARGVPAEAVLIEPTATNTGQNISRTRELLSERGIEVRSAILISKPYQQRRAYATSRKLWPEIEITCASLPISLDDYVAGIGDPDRVVNMLVGDTQRIVEYAKAGYAIEQPFPADVRSAYERLVEAGYTSRLI